MARLAVTGQGLTNQTRLDRGITDLMVVQTASGPVLYALSGPNGGVSAYAIGAGGALTLIDFLHFSPSMSESIMRDLALIDTPEGPRLVVGGNAASGLTSFALAANGMIGGEARTPGLSGINGTVLDIGQGDGGALFVTQAGGASLQAYAPTQAGTLVRQPLAIDIPATYGDTIFAMERLSLGGASFLLGASQTEGGVAAYRITSEGLVASGTLGTAEGIGVMTPTAFRTTMIGDRGFVLLGSAPSDGIGRAGAITVMQVTEDGLLLPVDHLLDSRDSRFGNLQSLEVVQANGFTYVLAAGADGGITLFAMLPNGRLQILDVLADATTVALGAISAISAIDMGGQIGVFLGSEAGAGVRVLGFDTAANGIQRMATAAGGTLTGGAGNDILVGGVGNDLLEGGAGDDILEDGGGADTLTGGPGRDIFVLRADGLTDRITDFEPGRDRLDLSGWPFLYDPAQLTVIPTGGGALVLWRTEALILDSMMGGPLTSAQVIGSVIMGAQRGPIQFAPPPDPDQLLQGTSGNDTLDGGAGNDTILGLDGNDQLIGGYDADMLDGGAGRDTLFGSDDNDTLFGGAGFDRLFGGGGFDRLEGGDQADNLFGGDGEDTLLGDSGNDRLFGGADDDRLDGGDGNDFIRGDAGRDTLEGGAGADRLFGGSGFDLLYGGAGNDLVRGGAQADNLFGDDGNDRLFGDIGNDRLFGGAGDDRLFGGAGADRLFGGTGNDLLEGGGDSDGLEGGAGNDTLLGGGGFDRLLGGVGADVLQGGDQADNLFGGGGNDTLMGENGNDRLFGGSGRDLLEGGDGNDALRGNGGFDTLIGGAGNDLLIGGGNWDVFVFEDGHGNDTITDFGATNPFERIDLSSMTTLAAGDFDGLVAARAITGQMGGVTINTGSGSIFLLNTDMDDLDPSDFIF